MLGKLSDQENGGRIVGCSLPPDIKHSTGTVIGPKGSVECENRHGFSSNDSRNEMPGSL